MPKLAKKDDNEVSRLEVVYPDVKVEFENRTITVRPLNLEELPSIADVLISIIDMKSQGKTDEQLLVYALRDILKVVEICVDIPLAEIPAALSLRIARIVLKQNFTHNVMGEWQALRNEVVAAFGSQGNG